MRETLGITNEKTLSKMIMRIATNNKENPETYISHVWGRNDQGQLGQQG